MTNNWIEHNGGPRPVGEDVLVSMRLRGGQVRSPRIKWEHCGGPGDVVAYRILNQHLIDAARLEGIRLGLEAAVKEIAEREEAASNCPDGGSEWLRTDHMKADIRALNPDTIAQEADQ